MKKTALLLLVLIVITFTSCSYTITETAETGPAESIAETEAQIETTTEKTVTQLSFGDAIVTEMFRFTPSFDGFADEVANWPDENYLKPNGSISGSNPFKAADGKTMMYFSGVVEYIGNSKQNESFSVYYQVDYDDGYIFNGNNDYNMTTSESQDARYHTGWGNSADGKNWDYSNTMTFAPLSTITKRYVRFTIEVPAVLESETGKPLNVIFRVDGNDYCFKLR